jgi:hypothetical protein
VNINRFKGFTILLLLPMFASLCLALGKSSDGTYTIRCAVLNNAGGTISNGIYAMDNSVGQSSAIGVSNSASGSLRRTYAGYQLPLILDDANLLTNYRVSATLDMQLRWKKIPWATGYNVYENGVDPFGPFTLLGSTRTTTYTHSGVTAVALKQFYHVRALRPWVTP